MKKDVSNAELVNAVMAEVDDRIKIRRIHDDKEKEEIKEASRCFIHVTEDAQEVYLMLYKREDRDYTVEDIEEYLKSQNITYGIKKNIINDMLEQKCYYEEILVAEGVKPREGKDAYFEFHFNTEPETKPIIFPDGSVDYNILGKIELVQKDQLIVTYHEPEQGEDGIDVFENRIPAKVVKNINPLKGKGFELTTDQKEYYASLEGRVTCKEHSLNVTPIFIVEGDVEAATGDINFNGDVLVKGNVFSNVTITATANITINGHVEIANLIAGKDVLLKNGMQGSGIGTINAKGNVMAKFLEQTQVHANGNISANAILNCVTESNKTILVSGTRGAILGGSAKAVEKIMAFSLGNKVGICTKLVIGLEQDFKKLMSAVDEEIDDWKDKLFDTEKVLKNLSRRIITSSDPILRENRNSVLRDKILYQTKIRELTIKKEEIIDIKERSSNGSVLILGQANAGSTIIIDGVSEELKSECKNVTFVKRKNEIRIFTNNIEDKTKKKR